MLEKNKCFLQFYCCLTISSRSRRRRKNANIVSSTWKREMMIGTDEHRVNDTYLRMVDLPVVLSCASWFMVKSQVTDLLGDNFYECNDSVFCSTHTTSVDRRYEHHVKTFPPAITSTLFNCLKCSRENKIDRLVDCIHPRTNLLRKQTQCLHCRDGASDKWQNINTNDFILQMVNFIIQCVYLRLNKNVLLFIFCLICCQIVRLTISLTKIT